VARPLFSVFLCGGGKKGSGDLTIEFACDKIARFWRALIADVEPKRGVKDLWDYVSQLYICNNSRDLYKRDA